MIQPNKWMVCDRNCTHFTHTLEQVVDSEPAQLRGVVWIWGVRLRSQNQRLRGLHQTTGNLWIVSVRFDPIARLVEGIDQAINLTLA
ncbi:MAG: hypothetical protein HC790_10010 [Acaryochloridaceae cyanobacterium CSU_3_4]|nr:hypothetical protein [Acaryochloridaceae cyanobacterium CSU_3_4]